MPVRDVIARQFHHFPGLPGNYVWNYPIISVKFLMHVVLCAPLMTIPLESSTASHPPGTRAQDAELCCLMITWKQTTLDNICSYKNYNSEQSKPDQCFLQHIAQKKISMGKIRRHLNYNTSTRSNFKLHILDLFTTLPIILAYHSLDLPKPLGYITHTFNPHGSASSNSLAEPA